MRTTTTTPSRWSTRLVVEDESEAAAEPAAPAGPEGQTKGDDEDEEEDDFDPDDVEADLDAILKDRIAAAEDDDDEDEDEEVPGREERSDGADRVQPKRPERVRVPVLLPGEAPEPAGRHQAPALRRLRLTPTAPGLDAEPRRGGLTRLADARPETIRQATPVRSTVLDRSSTPPLGSGPRRPAAWCPNWPAGAAAQLGGPGDRAELAVQLGSSVRRRARRRPGRPRAEDALVGVDASRPATGANGAAPSTEARGGDVGDRTPPPASTSPRAGRSRRQSRRHSRPSRKGRGLGRGPRPRKPTGRRHSPSPEYDSLTTYQVVSPPARLRRAGWTGRAALRGRTTGARPSSAGRPAPGRARSCSPCPTACPARRTGCHRPDRRYRGDRYGRPAKLTPMTGPWCAAAHGVADPSYRGSARGGGRSSPLDRAPDGRPTCWPWWARSTVRWSASRWRPRALTEASVRVASVTDLWVSPRPGRWGWGRRCSTQSSPGRRRPAVRRRTPSRFRATAPPRTSSSARAGGTGHPWSTRRFAGTAT